MQIFSTTHIGRFDTKTLFYFLFLFLFSLQKRDIRCIRLDRLIEDQLRKMCITGEREEALKEEMILSLR